MTKKPLFSDTLTVRIPAFNRATKEQVVDFRLNPDNQLSEHDYDNNTLVLGGNSPTELPFTPDHVSPILEVTFDGQQIENEGFVAPRPLISLRVRDENPRLFRHDTTGLLLYLQRPSQALSGTFDRLSWKQATGRSEDGGRSFRVDFRPADPWPDGRYQLEAYGNDLSGNRAAPYRITFKIAREPGISVAGVGPNPFGGSAPQTRFFCTLTGTTPPETIELTLTNLIGKTVRTVQLPSHIGLNEWVWAGTDNTGNVLPAGLYLYRFGFVGSNAVGFNRLSVNSLTGRVLLVR